MSLLFVIGLGLWMLADGIDGNVRPFIKLAGGIFVLLSPFFQI